MKGVGELLDLTFGVMKDRWLTLVLLGLLSGALLTVSIIVPILPGILCSVLLGDISGPAMAVSLLAAVIVTFWSASLCMAAFHLAVTDRACGVTESFRRARPMAHSFLWLGFLTGMLVQGAYFLFLVPGIILSVWFMFAMFIMVEEGRYGMDALMRSREYVRGRWFPIAGRFLAVWLVAWLVAMIPLMGQLLAPPIILVFTCLMYRDLKAIRGGILPEPTSGAKAGILATGIGGFLVIPVLIIALMGATLLSFCGQMKGSVRDGQIRMELSLPPIESIMDDRN
jgi:hypothetical protein